MKETFELSDKVSLDVDSVGARTRGKLIGFELEYTCYGDGSVEVLIRTKQFLERCYSVYATGPYYVKQEIFLHGFRKEDYDEGVIPVYPCILSTGRYFKMSDSITSWANSFWLAFYAPTKSDLVKYILKYGNMVKCDAIYTRPPTQSLVIKIIELERFERQR